MTRHHEPDPVAGGPTMQARTVVGVFGDFAPAEAAVACLQAAGLRYHDLSVAARPVLSAPERGAEDTQATEGALAGASLGGVLGGALALTSLAVPGLGSLIVGGPLLTALAGALMGGAAGGLAGSYVGLGIPKERALAYEASVRAGGVILSVTVPTAADAQHVARIFTETGARAVADYQPAL